MDGFLTKPFSITELKESIEEFGDGVAKELQGELLEANGQIEFSGHAKVTEDINAEIFNIKAINNIREVEEQTGRPLLPSVLDGFTVQMQEKLIEMSSNLGDGDCEKMYRTAHAIKSMSANIGAEKVRSISAQLELRGKEGKLGDLTAEMTMLSDAYSEFVEEFRSRFIA